MARNFVGDNTTVLRRTGAVLSTHPITMAAWIRQTNIIAQNQVIIAINDTTSNLNGWVLRSLPTSGFLSVSYGTGTFGTATTSVAVTAGQWNHVAAVCPSSASRTAYLNGVASTTDTTAVGGTPVPTETNIAVWQGVGQYFNGSIAEAGIWNVALDSAELVALAAGISPALVRPSALVAYYPLLGATSPEPDLMRGQNLTVTGATASAHCRILVPAHLYAETLHLIFRAITGITKSISGTPIGGCTVKLFRTSDDAKLATTTSDGSGNYAFTVTGGATTTYYVLAYKPGSPDLAGTTVNTIVGV